MTKIDSQTIKCPECGNSQDVVLCDSLNVDLNPDIREKLFSGEINVFKCNSCEFEAFINKPLLYHDMTRQYCVQYFPPELTEDDKFYANFNSAGKFDIPGIPDGNYLKEPHIVFNINEMIIYITFRDKLFEIKK